MTSERTRNRIASIAGKVLAGGEADRDDLKFLMGLKGAALYELFYWADRLRRKFHGDKVRFCSIISAKQGRCPEDCKFCAQSSHYRTGASSHPLVTARRTVAAARRAAETGADSFGVVTSGRRPTRRDWPRLLGIIGGVAALGAVRPCASLGALTVEGARELKKAGLVRYHHNLETSRRHFTKICTTHTYDERLATLRAVKEAGLELCCGGIFGIGETNTDRVDLALTVREFDPDSVPLNFLNPVPGTPLAGSPPLRPLDVLKIIAVFRVALPRQEIKVCGGREVNLRHLQSWMFYAGATGAIIGDYLTTTGRPAADDVQMIDDLGLTIDRGRNPR